MSLSQQFDDNENKNLNFSLIKSYDKTITKLSVSSVVVSNTKYKQNKSAVGYVVFACFRSENMESLVY